MDRQTRTRILALFRRRIFRTLMFKYVVVAAAVFLLLWGVAVLALRVSGIDNPLFFAAGLSVFAAIPPIAGLAAARRVPDLQTLASILDRDNATGGLLMSSFETELGDWSERIGELTVPNVRWMPRRTAGLIVVSILFAISALFFPVASLSGKEGGRLNIDDQVKRLTTQLDVLEEEKLLDVEEVESRKLELDKIRKDADGMGPVKTFDALDHISERMNRKAAEAVEEAQRTTQTLAETKALSEQVREIHDKLDDSTRKSLMDGLADSLEEMLAQNEQLAEDLKKTLKDRIEQEKKKEGEENRDGENKENEGETAKDDALLETLKKMLDDKTMQGMTPEMLQQLCETMQQCQGDCERMCENLRDAGFPIDREMLKKLAESRKIDKEEAQRMLSDLWANCDGCDGEPGSSGERRQERFSPRYSQKQDWRTDPDEPPGDTRFVKDPDEEGAEFKAKVLPPADLEAFRNSLKIGASISAPDFDPEGTPGDHGGAIRDTTGGTGTAHGQTIYPQHRGPVGRYFEK